MNSKNSNKKENKKQTKIIAPEIDKAIKREAEMFNSKSWKIQSHDGFYII